MKTWNQLSEAQQQRAIQMRMGEFLEAITQGLVEFNDEPINAKIKRALEKAERMQTPWFAAQYVRDEIEDYLKIICHEECEDILYVEPHEMVMDEPTECND